MELSRAEQIKELVEYLVGSIDIDSLVTYFEEGQLDYFDGLSDERIKAEYTNCFGEDEE